MHKRKIVIVIATFILAILSCNYIIDYKKIGEETNVKKEEVLDIAKINNEFYKDRVLKIESILGTEKDKYAIYTYNIKEDKYPFIYNSRPMRSASMIKVFILGKLMDDFDKKIINLDEDIVMKEEDIVGGAGIIQGYMPGTKFSIKQLAYLMIAESDNTATNLLIDRLTMDKINEYLLEKGYKDTHLYSKMMNMNSKDTDKKNQTSVLDLGNFFTRLIKGNDFSQEAKDFMLNTLLNQQDKEGMPYALPNLLIAHKTGEVRGLYDDGGIVFYEDMPIIICIMDDNIYRDDAIYNIRNIAQYIIYGN